MVSQNSKPPGSKGEPRYRRFGGGCASSILETDGPKEWSSMEEFSEYLRTWQGRNNVELVYWDSKRSKTYNTSNKLNKANPKYLHDSLTEFAYKAWVCVHGRRGTKNPCRFMVRARFLPVEKKVICKVIKHTGLGALENGHNHHLEGVSCHVPCSAELDGTGDLVEPAEEKSIVKQMREDPQGSASLMAGWGLCKRRRVCIASIKKFVNYLSRPDLCDARQMIEALNVVDLMADSIKRRERMRPKEEKKGDISGHNEAIKSHRKKNSSSARKKVILSSYDEHDSAQEESGDLDDLRAFCSSPEEGECKNDDEVRDGDDDGVWSYMVGRPVRDENVPQSKYARRASLVENTESLAALLRMLDSGGTIGEFLQKFERFPRPLKQNVRVLEVFKCDDTELTPCESVHFIIEPDVLDNMISMAVSHKKNFEKSERSDGDKQEQRDEVEVATEVVDEEEAADNYGVTFQIFEKVGRNVVECTSMKLKLSALIGMRRVREVLELMRESKKFIEWVSNIDESMETIAERKKLENSKGYVMREFPLLKAINFQGRNFKSGFAFFLESFLSLRGCIGHCKGRWLTSDAVHMGILRLREEFERDLGSTVFVLPPLQWDSDSIFDEHFEGLRKSRSLLKKTKGEGEHFYEILLNQRETLMDATERNLESAVVYTVVNKSGNHWIGLEACVRTRNVVLYDPADTRGRRDGEESGKYFERMRSVLELLFKRRNVTPPPLKYNQWKISWTKGGQQALSADSVNCGVYVLQWIKFRLKSSVLYRRTLERKEGTSFLREKLRDTTMGVFDSQFFEKDRCLMAEFALREMRRQQLMNEQKVYIFRNSEKEEGNN